MRAPLVVLKVGGDMLLDAEERTGLADNVRSLVDSGARIVVVHGGGPQVNTLQEKVGLTPVKVAGRRVTGPADLVVVTQAICGEVNVALTSLFLSVGVRAFGCHGASARLIRATRRPAKVVSGAGPDPVDFGLVGDVVSVDGALLEGLTALGVVPVIATLGVDESAQVLNINADTTVAAVASTLGADLLLLITKVGGVFKDVDDKSTRIATLDRESASQFIQDGVISGGMIPKVEEALLTLDAGVRSVAIVSALERDSFKSALSGSERAGTRFVRR
jgi:acetylglutamate kinase